MLSSINKDIGNIKRNTKVIILESFPNNCYFCVISVSFDTFLFKNKNTMIISGKDLTSEPENTDCYINSKYEKLKKNFKFNQFFNKLKYEKFL